MLKEFHIAYGYSEDVPQYGDPVSRNAWWGGEGAAEVIAGSNEVHNLSLVCPTTISSTAGTPGKSGTFGLICASTVIISCSNHSLLEAFQLDHVSVSA